MGFRTVVVRKRCKLELSMNYLVCRGETTRKVNISEITTLVIQSTTVSITAALLCELLKQKVKVIFCDEKNNPFSELVPYYATCNSPKTINEQIGWNKEGIIAVWTRIVKEKIKNQRNVLDKYGKVEENA